MIEKENSQPCQTAGDADGYEQSTKKTNPVRAKLDRKNLLVYPEIMKPKFDDF